MCDLSRSEGEIIMYLRQQIGMGMKIVASFGLGIVFGFFLQAIFKDEPSGSSIAKSVQPEPVPALHIDSAFSTGKNPLQTNQIKILVQENSNLRNEIDEYKKQIAAYKHADLNTAGLSENKIKANALQEFKAIQAANDVAKYIASSGADYPRIMESSFKSENIDFSWAAGNEEKISTLFRNNPALNDFVPELVECRSTRCQIRMNPANDEDANRVMELLSKALINNKLELSATSVMSAPDLSSGALNLYIGRNDDVKFF